MALHRDIFWVGRQWAVTGSGIQAVDQRRRSEFDIEISRLWDDGLCARMREQPWFIVDDFEKALAMARARYPAPPGNTSLKTLPKTSAEISPRTPPSEAQVLSPVEPGQIEPPQPVRQSLMWRIERASARFLPQWRVRR
jgi:hypothetical protein